MLLRILNETILCHFWQQDPCEKCGRIDRRITVMAPTRFEEQGDLILVALPYACQCRQWGALEINMPTVLFSYILLRSVMLAHQMRKSKVERSFVPKRSELFEMFLADFVESSRPSASVPAPKAKKISKKEMGDFLDDLDATDFVVPARGWAEILRKMGFDPNNLDPDFSE